MKARNKERRPKKNVFGKIIAVADDRLCLQDLIFSVDGDDKENDDGNNRKKEEPRPTTVVFPLRFVSFKQKTLNQKRHAMMRFLC